MEEKLRTLFDYQKFEHNESLLKLIGETHRRVLSSNALSDDVMSNISAAGIISLAETSALKESIELNQIK